MAGNGIVKSGSGGIWVGLCRKNRAVEAIGGIAQINTASSHASGTMTAVFVAII